MRHGVDMPYDARRLRRCYAMPAIRKARRTLPRAAVMFMLMIDYADTRREVMRSRAHCRYDDVDTLA